MQENNVRHSRLRLDRLGLTMRRCFATRNTIVNILLPLITPRKARFPDRMSRPIGIITSAMTPNMLSLSTRHLQRHAAKNSLIPSSIWHPSRMGSHLLKSSDWVLVRRELGSKHFDSRRNQCFEAAPLHDTAFAFIIKIINARPACTPQISK